MKLTVVGCAGSFPGPEAPCSSYLVEAEGFRLLVDFGTGSLGALQRYADMHSIDAVALSHLHADHILDACSYVVARRYAPDAPLPLIPLYGPQGTPERLGAAYDGGVHSLEDVYDFHTMRPGTFQVGPFRLTVDRVNHPVETYGMRLEHGGRTLAYSADTGSCDALTKLAEGADLFLCEASYLADCDNPPDLHLTGIEAGEHATRAGAHRLLLTHLVQAWGNEARTVEEAGSRYAGPIEVVRPGAIYQL
ncbi:MAG: MBL fold metallo-hydrolase [Micromonosporaceae bacterium]